MGIVRPDGKARDLCAQVLAERVLELENRFGAGDFDPTSDQIKGMTRHASKALEFPVVALLDVRHMPAPGEDEKKAAWMFYVVGTRATQRLVMDTGGSGEFGRRLTS